MGTTITKPQAHQALLPGKLLVSTDRITNGILKQSILLLLEHDETGSTGIILNKKSIDLDESSNPYFYGGTYDTHRIGFLHAYEPKCRRAVRISDNIYYCEHCDKIPAPEFRNELIKTGQLAFIGFTVWNPMQLENELNDGYWWIDDFTIDQLQELSKSNHWQKRNFHYKLLNPSYSELILN